MFRLFVLQARQLEGGIQESLETAILAGPPRKMFHYSLDSVQWKDLVARSVWLRLTKLSEAGCTLGKSAAARLAEISTAYPLWQLTPNEREEFSHWMSGSGDPDFEDNREVDIAPIKRQELVNWLVKPVVKRLPFNEDTWKNVCRKHLLNSLYALSDLAERGEWPVERWREALNAWSDKGIVRRSWRYVPSVLETMPDDVLHEIEYAVTWWMEAVSKSITRSENILLHLCRRVLSLPLKAESGSSTRKGGVEVYDPVGSAINHPVGLVTQTLINLWFKQNPNDNDLLPIELKPMFTSLCDTQVDKFHFGRVILGSRLIALFRVDRSWTEQFLLPLLSWDNPSEAKAVWSGFLWSPRLYQALMISFKPQFLECASHYVDLGEHRQQFAVLLTYAALEQTDGYTKHEFQSAISKLPQEGLEEAAQALYQALDGAGDQREDYWKNRVMPLWQQIWPKKRDLATPRMAVSLTRLAIAAKGEFPAALATVKDWLQAIENPNLVVHLLYKSKLCTRFPTDALMLLNVIVADQQWAPKNLGDCLGDIAQSDPTLGNDVRYLRLCEYVRRREA